MAYIFYIFKLGSIHQLTSPFILVLVMSYILEIYNMIDK